MRPDERPRPTAEQLSKVFQRLADRHAEERAKLSVARSWARLQHKLERSKRRRLSLASSVIIGSAFDFSGLLRSRAALAALATMVAAGAWTLWPSDEQLLHYEVRAQGEVSPQQRRSDWIRTSARSAEVVFSDGSRLTAEPESTLQLEVTGKHSAMVELVSGALSADIHHADSTHWRLQAGPYEIVVVGTRFDLRYDAQGLSLFMHTGSVAVSSEDGQHWALEAGQHLSLPKPAEPDREALERHREQLTESKAPTLRDRDLPNADSPSASEPRLD